MQATPIEALASILDWARDKSLPDDVKLELIGQTARRTLTAAVNKHEANYPHRTWPDPFEIYTARYALRDHSI